MLFTVVFVLIFLIGFSLFAAVLGSSFLRKHAKRVVKKKARMQQEHAISEREIARRFRAEYEEGVEEITRKGRALQAPAAGPAVYIPPAGSQRKAGMWVLISLAIAAVVATSFFFGYGRVSEFLKRPRLIFCEGVDYVKLKPIHSSNTFTRGNVTIFVRSGRTLDTESATIEIFRIGPQGPEYFDRKTIPVRKYWTSFSIKTLFDRIGSYSVKVFEEGGDLLAEKIIFIVPDSYAYRPVAAP
jgi:hypothetical protein